MSSCCVLRKSLLLPPLWCLSRVKSLFSLGRKGGSCLCIHSALTPALPQRQPSLLTVSEMYLCIKGFVNNLSVPFVCKETTKLAMKFSHFFYPPAYSLIGYHHKHTGQSDVFFSGFVSSEIHTFRAHSPLFVCVYVIAWQGSAPSRLCEGLNVIHWAETVLLPASLPFCL